MGWRDSTFFVHADDMFRFAITGTALRHLQSLDTNTLVGVVRGIMRLSADVSDEPDLWPFDLPQEQSPQHDPPLKYHP